MVVASNAHQNEQIGGLESSRVWRRHRGGIASSPQHTTLSEVWGDRIEELTLDQTCGGGMAAASRVACCTPAADSCAEPASVMRRLCRFTGADIPSGSVSVSPGCPCTRGGDEVFDMALHSGSSIGPCRRVKHNQPWSIQHGERA